MPCFEGERHFVGGSFSTGEWEENATYLGGAVPKIGGYSAP